MLVKDKIDPNNIPKHVAVIMDGNGRWAKEKGQDRIYGHMNGVGSVRSTLESATKLGVEFLTLYAFSTENWNRPKKEVDALMTLLVETIYNEVAELDKNGVRLMAIGNLASLPEDCQNTLQKAIDKTSKNTTITLVLALSYSSKWEMIEAVKSIAEKVKNSELSLSEIDENVFSAHLTTNNIPDPELLIRTSGESRISNFLLWQIAYSELYFTEVLWPDFTEEVFYKAIYDYQQRERRFGKTSEQLKA